MRSSEALKDSLQKRIKKKHKNPKKVIITDMIILAYKQRCTRDSRDCQREQNLERCVGGCIFLYSSCLCHAKHIPLFFTASKPLQPVGSAAAATLPDHRAGGKLWHGGVNTSVRLKHHLLKHSPACSGHGIAVTAVISPL